MRHQRRARCSKSRHDIEHAARNSGLSGYLTKRNRSKRRELRRLEHASISRSQTGTQVPRAEHQRRVPWNDNRADSDRWTFGKVHEAHIAAEKFRIALRRLVS